LAASSRSLAVCRLGLGSLSVDRDEVGVADVMVGERLPVGEVTLLFSDVEGSTRLLHEIGELFGEVLAEHDRVLREVWAAFGGRW
jgi:class 3 adenylate cyclase